VLPLIRRSALALAIAIASLATLGCDGGGGGSKYGPADNPTTVRDVTGVVFGWNCAADCSVGFVMSTPPADPCGGGDRSAYSYQWGRFFDICSVCVATDSAGQLYWSTTPGQCRMLACDTAADCPLIYAYSPNTVYECVDGLCQAADQNLHPRTPLTRTDAQDLCYAVYDRSATSNPFYATSQQVQADLNANCTGTYPMDTCTLPADCRAP